MAWLEVHQSLPTHRKTLAVADALDVPPVHVVGHLVSLWLWALDNVPDGRMVKVSDRNISRAAQWEGQAAEWVNALVGAGFLDRDGDDLLIHNWDDYAGKLIQRRRANADRMRKERSAERAMHVQSTDAARAPATVQNSTVENTTQHDTAPVTPSIVRAPDPLPMFPVTQPDLHAESDDSAVADITPAKSLKKARAPKEATDPTYRSRFTALAMGCGHDPTNLCESEAKLLGKNTVKLWQYSPEQVTAMCDNWPTHYGFPISSTQVVVNASKLLTPGARALSPPRPAYSAPGRPPVSNGSPKGGLTPDEARALERLGIRKVAPAGGAGPGSVQPAL